MKNSEVAIIVFHEYLGSNKTMKHINSLTQKGFVIECPNILGHGTRYEDLENVKYTDWINQIEEIYFNLRNNYKAIFVVGFSFGGLLALYLAQKYSNQITGMILINNFLFPTLCIYINSFYKKFVRFMPNLKYDMKDQKLNDYVFYGKISSKNCAEVIKLSKIVRKNIKKCTVPTLIFKSKKTHIFDNRNVTKTYKSIMSKHKKLVYLNNTHQADVLDFDKDMIKENIIKFIEGVYYL